MTTVKKNITTTIFIQQHCAHCDQLLIIYLSDKTIMNNMKFIISLIQITCCLFCLLPSSVTSSRVDPFPPCPCSSSSPSSLCSAASTNFDYIVLGAGGAGSIIARKLADAFPNKRIGLLEAGCKKERKKENKHENYAYAMHVAITVSSHLFLSLSLSSFFTLSFVLCVSGSPLNY